MQLVHKKQICTYIKKTSCASATCDQDSTWKISYYYICGEILFIMRLVTQQIQLQNREYETAIVQYSIS